MVLIFRTAGIWKVYENMEEPLSECVTAVGAIKLSVPLCACVFGVTPTCESTY